MEKGMQLCVPFLIFDYYLKKTQYGRLFIFSW